MGEMTKSTKTIQAHKLYKKHVAVCKPASNTDNLHTAIRTQVLHQIRVGISLVGKSKTTIFFQLNSPAHSMCFIRNAYEILDFPQKSSSVVALYGTCKPGPAYLEENPGFADIRKATGLRSGISYTEHLTALTENPASTGRKMKLVLVGLVLVLVVGAQAQWYKFSRKAVRFTKEVIQGKNKEIHFAKICIVYWCLCLIQGSRDMWRAYSDMKEANWKDSGKYFHSRGNYDAARRGPGGRWAAEVLRQDIICGLHDDY
nr:uncharacterized protein LOC111848015 [Paramormyrops kingsleyae]